MRLRGKHPDPPIDKMLRGQVWEVSLLQRRRQFETPFGEARQRFVKFLLMMIDPLDHDWPECKFRWYHSTFRLGNLGKRTEEEVWADLRILKAQDPPYKRNYRPLTKLYQGDVLYWERSVEWRTQND